MDSNRRLLTFSKSEFNPDIIIESGQVFRMNKLSAWGYSAFSGDKAIFFRKFSATPQTYTWEFQCSSQDWNQFWLHYFDFNRSYSKYNQVIMSSSDEFLKSALKSAEGMRILHQDLWETMVSFIISQQNNIPKIQKTINQLCFNYGHISHFEVGQNSEKFYTFPTAEQISRLKLEELQGGSLLGYRAKYILELAQAVQKRKFKLDKLINLKYQDALAELQSIKGIGPKVGNCITLYGLHLLESYPIDVWMKRIIEQDYPEFTEQEYLDYINKNYSGFQGYVQQLQFFFKRKMKTP